MFKKSILIVAHPDDEILWFSSIVEQVDEIIFSFLDYTPEPTLGAGRRKVIADYPLPNVSCLNIAEAESFNGTDWSNPLETEYGLEISRNRVSAKRYRDNFYVLRDRIREKLETAENVFTHNPWGEYGHEDHVQIYRLVNSLQERYKFNLWFSNYCGNRSSLLMFNNISGYARDYVTLPTNTKFAHRIADLYKANGCWTWYDDYLWFKDESFMLDQEYHRNREPYGHLFPLNMVKTNFPDTPRATNKTRGLRRFINTLSRRV